MAVVSSLWRCPDKRVLFASLWRSLRRQSGRRGFALEKHRDATYHWICQAQDATSDGGVAGWYHLLEGWSASYPETTGYLVPTVLAYGVATENGEASQRATRMADWEAEEQLPSGAVQSGLVGTTTAPAVFNTGQVLSAWTATDRFNARGDYADAAERAAHWLISVQDEDGAWRRQLSALTTSSVQSYNARTAWALAEAGVVYSEPNWIEAARRNADWVLAQQSETGWFHHATFAPGEIPLLHTLAYVIEGILGLGLLLDEEAYIESARRAIEGLLKARRRGDGLFLAGRYDDGWLPRASWRCLTGEAQIVAALLRLARSSSNEEYARIARGLLDGLCCSQDLDESLAPTCGGLAGSSPVWAEYCPFAYVNWAAKFFLDALLLYLDDVDPHDFHGWRKNATDVVALRTAQQ